MSTAVHGTLDASFDGSWERVNLKARFVETSWTSPRDLEAQAVTYEIARADGGILNRGSSPLIELDDSVLGNQEVLTARACIFLQPWYAREKQAHCSTAALTSSAKRFVPLNLEASYPRGGAVELPNIAFQQELQRTTFGRPADWARMRLIAEPVLLKAWIANAPNESVQISLSPSSTVQSVDLRNGDGFAAFQASYHRAQAAGADVTVLFQFHTSMLADASAYPTKVVMLEGKNERERFAELQVMADRAARHMVGVHYGGGGDITARIIEWSFDPRSRSFSSKVKISWAGRNVSSNSYSIQGLFAASETGEDSSFELTNEGEFPFAVRLLSGITIKIGTVVKDVLAQ